MSERFLLDLPVDFDELTKLGSMMGSGGLIVLDEDTCMVELARYFVISCVMNLAENVHPVVKD